MQTQFKDEFCMIRSLCDHSYWVACGMCEKPTSVYHSALGVAQIVFVYQYIKTFLTKINILKFSLKSNLK